MESTGGTGVQVPYCLPSQTSHDMMMMMLSLPTYDDDVFTTYLLYDMMMMRRELVRVQQEILDEKMRLVQLESELKAREEEQGRLRKVGG